MNEELNPLASYDLLRQQHTEQIEPLLARLHQQVDAELAQIRQRSADLLAERTCSLQELKTAISTDARFLLSTRQFREFFDRFLKTAPRQYDPLPEVDADVANWSICSSDRSVRVFEYQDACDLDDYDDERTYASYGFGVKIAWGEQTTEIDYIRTLKIYGVEDRYNSFDETAKQISWYLEDLYPDEEAGISLELSNLVLYCCLLLAQKPPSIEFAYNSVEIEERDLWAGMYI